MDEDRRRIGVAGAIAGPPPRCQHCNCFQRFPVGINAKLLTNHNCTIFSNCFVSHPRLDTETAAAGGETASTTTTSQMRSVSSLPRENRVISREHCRRSSFGCVYGKPEGQLNLETIIHTNWTDKMMGQTPISAVACNCWREREGGERRDRPLYIGVSHLSIVSGGSLAATLTD